jgi:hypothetical protein
LQGGAAPRRLAHLRGLAKFRRSLVGWINPDVKDCVMIKITLLSIATLAASTLVAYPATAMPRSGVTSSDSDLVLVAKKKKLTRQQEVDQSVQSGTVPARYRSSVPKQYQQYIPWAK